MNLVIGQKTKKYSTSFIQVSHKKASLRTREHVKYLCKESSHNLLLAAENEIVEE